MNGSNRSRPPAVARSDLAFRAVLVACLWIILYLLHAAITQAVIIATLTAIFGPDVLRAGLDRFSGQGRDR